MSFLSPLQALMAKPEGPNNLLSLALQGKAGGVEGCITKDPKNINSRSLKRGFSPLQCAACAETGATATMDVLIAAGADIKHQDMFGMTVLHVAADKENSEAIMKLITLPDIKSILEVTDEDGCTAIHYAASSGRLEIVTELMKLGAQHEVDNAAGQKPETLATEGEHAEVVALLQNGLPKAPGAEGGGEEEGED